MMLDQMQIPILVSPLSSEEPTSFIDPMPQQIVLGHTILTNDCEEFLQALDGGIESYCQSDYERASMTAQDLLNTLLDQHTPLVWRLGFLAGQVAGFLNPDIAETGEPHSCVEVLSRKCKHLYTGVRLSVQHHTEGASGHRDQDAAGRSRDNRVLMCS